MPDTGYLYLTVDELCAGALVHLISGVDAQHGLATAPGAVATHITGYTEWVREGGRLLTIGWDWQMTAHGERVCLQRIGAPSSNLMLQSRARRDLGHARTVELLKEYLDGFNWQAATLCHISTRYG
ncbi:DUF4902 domain-containing protein [Massilia sp. S19_KUP03_FR1]|uniref:DUF4902 domain-containing protein n=1 Tax=Massilia sp. S19_KUP03_FR1 TaxID=3025503 RepID=UPI002FCD8BEA